MSLNLPKWEDLSRDEQVPIYNLPLDRTYIITGGPGTGKTVLAIHRAAKLKSQIKQNKEGYYKVKFLVFNRPLMMYIKRALEEVGLIGEEIFLDEIEHNGNISQVDFDVQTWHSWFYNFFPGSVPEIERYKPDWKKILNNNRFLKKIEKQIWDHLIIDEAQDFPLELLKILKSLAKNVTIFADPNQSIIENVNIAEILRIFEAGERRYFLTRNYRNTVEICETAKIFYTGDKNNLPSTSMRNGEKPYMVKHNEDRDIFQRIVNVYENNPDSSIGIILPNFSSANNFSYKFTKYLENRKIKNLNVLLYTRKNYQNFHFDDNSVKILYFNVMKGLEFDTVFIPRTTGSFFNEEDEIKNNMIYVAITRAKNRVFLFYKYKYFEY